MAYKMKGHSIPGIKGFKSASKKNGRAASSAFQMKKSPLNKEDKAVTLDADTDWSKITPAAEENIGASAKESGQGGWNYAIQEIAKAIKRKKAAKAAKTPSEKMDDQTNKDVTVDTDDSLTGKDAIAQVTNNYDKSLDESDEDFEKRTDYDDMSTEELMRMKELKEKENYQAVSPGGPGEIEIKG